MRMVSLCACISICMCAAYVLLSACELCASCYAHYAYEVLFSVHVHSIANPNLYLVAYLFKYDVNFIFVTF